MVSTRFSRICALLLLGSVVTGVLAPGAVAYSRDDIRTAAERSDLSGEVRDFLTKALEDAMVRAALVGPVTTLASWTPRRLDGERPDFQLPGDLLDVDIDAPRLHAQSVPVSDTADVDGRPVHRAGPIHPRAP